MTPKQWDKFIKHREAIKKKVLSGKKYRDAVKMLSDLSQEPISENYHIYKMNRPMIELAINLELSKIPDRTVEAALDYFNSENKE